MLATVAIAVLMPALSMAYLSTGAPGSRLWYWQNPIPQGNDLRSISWVDNDTGWAVGTSGVVLKSLDGGVTWDSQYANTQLELTGVSFVSPTTGWAVGVNGTVRRTTDGGVNWATQSTGTTANFRDVSFVDSNVGVAVGDRGTTYSTIRYTTNGGASWSSGTTTATVQLTAVEMVTSSVGWAVGGSGTILKTTDGGANWITQPALSASGLNSVSFEPGGLVGYVVGNAAVPNWTVYKTVDGGATWSTVPGLGTTGAVNIYAVSTLDASSAVIVGASGVVRRTDDGGLTWANQNQTSLAGVNLRDVAIVDTLNAKMVGDIGTMLFTQDGGTIWQSQVQGTSASLYGATFVTAQSGWAVGSAGSILHTENGGSSWVTQSSGTTVLRGVAFSDALHGWVVGDAGVIKSTADGGLTWNSQTTPTTLTLNGVWFTDALNGWAVGNTGTALFTTDGGVTWTAKAMGTTRHLYGVWFADANNGWIVGQTGTIRRTTDGGATWVTSTSGTTQNLNAVHGVSSSQVWAVGNAGTVLRTINGGSTTWTNLTSASGTTQALYAVHFANASRGWFSGNYGVLRTTADGGTSWTAQNAGVPTSGVNIALRGLAFPDVLNGYVVGSSGVIRQTTDGGATWLSLQQGTTLRINSVEMAADGIGGWAATYSGNIMRTRDGGLTWYLEKSGTTQNLFGLDMIDSARGWVVGASGTIRRTADGGSTWAPQTSGTTGQFNAISSVDGTSAVAVGNTGLVKYTNDSGNTWVSATTVPTTASINDVKMVSSTVGYMVAINSAAGNVFKTTDGGATWVAQTTPFTSSLYGVHFIDANTGWVVGANVTAWTTNGGATWTRVLPPVNRTLYDVFFVSATRGWTVGSSGAVFSSEDGGLTWTAQDSGTVTRTLRGLSFTSLDQGWIVGDSGTILATTDQTDPTTTITVQPSLPDGDNGWYTTPAQIILASSKPGVTFYSWSSALGPFSTYSVPLSSPEGIKTLYYYSTDTAGRVEPVNSYPIKTDSVAPTIATSTTSSAVTTSTITLLWSAGTDAGSGVVGYDVFVDGLYAASSATTGTVLSGLTPNTLYQVTLETVDAAGNRSAPSLPYWVFTNPIDTSPLATVVTVLPSTPDGMNGWYVTTPTVELSRVPAEPGVTYYSWVSSAGPYSSYVSTITPPAGSSTLYYSTHAADINRADEPTRTLDFAVDTATVTAPSVAATATSWASVLATWAPVAAPPSGIDHYVVLVDGVRSATTTSTAYTITGLEPATTYLISVIAVSGAGAESAVSAQASATTSAAPLPAAPSVLLAKAPTGDTVYLNWLASTDATGTISYRVWRSLDGIAYSALATTTGGVDDRVYIDTGLRSSTQYWYAISTVDSRGESSLTSTAAATWAYTAPTTTPPDRVLGVTAVGGNGSVYLSWQPSSDPATIGYVVRRATASMSTMTTITPFPGGPPGDPILSATAYFDTTAQNGETYYYQVAEVNDKLVIGQPSVDVEAKPVAPYPANQPHPHYYGNESACICHATHSSTTLRPLVRFPKADQNTMCKTCHSPVVSFAEFVDPLLKSKHPQGATVTSSEPYSCVTCHSPLVADGAPLNNLMRTNQNTPCVVVTDTPAGNGFCYSCHGPGSTLPMGDLTVFESSGHNTLQPPATGANITCDVCHESHSSRNTRLLKYEGFMVCVQCHTSSATNPNQVDILSKLMLNEGANTKHPILPQDQVTGARMTCQNCHNTHTTTKEFPLVDPHNPGPTGTWTVPRSDEKTFCFTCHDGNALPTSVETSPWAEPVLARGGLTVTSNIEAAYSVNTHGFASRSSGTTTTAYLRPDMGYKYGDVLECRACHDPHGTANNDAILNRVTSADGGKTIYGVLTYKIPSGGKDFRFFCQTCHIWDSASHDARAGTSTTTFPVNCKACHGHSVGTVPGLNF